MALSSMGHSQASAQSLQSIAGGDTERKISFVLHEPENVSGGSNVTVSHTILTSLTWVTYGIVHPTVPNRGTVGCTRWAIDNSCT